MKWLKVIVADPTGQNRTMWVPESRIVAILEPVAPGGTSGIILDEGARPHPFDLADEEDGVVRLLADLAKENR